MNIAIGIILFLILIPFEIHLSLEENDMNVFKEIRIRWKRSYKSGGLLFLISFFLLIIVFILRITTSLENDTNWAKPLFTLLDSIFIAYLTSYLFYLFTSYIKDRIKEKKAYFILRNHLYLLTKNLGVLIAYAAFYKELVNKHMDVIDIINSDDDFSFYLLIQGSSIEFFSKDPFFKEGVINIIYEINRGKNNVISILEGIKAYRNHYEYLDENILNCLSSLEIKEIFKSEKEVFHFDYFKKHCDRFYLLKNIYEILKEEIDYSDYFEIIGKNSLILDSATKSKCLNYDMSKISVKIE